MSWLFFKHQKIFFYNLIYILLLSGIHVVVIIILKPVVNEAISFIVDLLETSIINFTLMIYIFSQPLVG